MIRVVAYIDGFNLYFGLKQARFKRYYWLDVAALSRTLLRPGQQLATTHYFSARIRDNGRNAADQKRQNDYLEALALQPGLEVVLRANHIFTQRINQMLRLDVFLAVLAPRVAFGRNDDGFAAVRAFEFDLRFGVIAHQTAQRRDLVVKGVGDGRLEAAGAARFRRAARLAGGVQFGLKRLELGGQILPV